MKFVSVAQRLHLQKPRPLVDCLQRRDWCPVLFKNGVPYGIRTRVTNVKG
jgi:hypothetical protein